METIPINFMGIPLSVSAFNEGDESTICKINLCGHDITHIVDDKINLSIKTSINNYFKEQWLTKTR